MRTSRRSLRATTSRKSSGDFCVGSIRNLSLCTCQPLGGDYGIEGFSTDGIAYQCYADQDSLGLRARTDKQKKKLYDDTVKLKTHADKSKVKRPRFSAAPMRVAALG